MTFESATLATTNYRTYNTYTIRIRFRSRFEDYVSASKADHESVLKDIAKMEDDLREFLIIVLLLSYIFNLYRSLNILIFHLLRFKL